MFKQQARDFSAMFHWYFSNNFQTKGGRHVISEFTGRVGTFESGITDTRILPNLNRRRHEKQSILILRLLHFMLQDEKLLQVEFV